MTERNIRPEPRIFVHFVTNKPLFNLFRKYLLKAGIPERNSRFSNRLYSDKVHIFYLVKTTERSFRRKASRRLYIDGTGFSQHYSKYYALRIDSLISRNSFVKAVIAANERGFVVGAAFVKLLAFNFEKVRIADFLLIFVKGFNRPNARLYWRKRKTDF